MGKQKCGEKGTSNNSKHTASSVKLGGGGVMASACIAASGTDFNEYLMYDDSSRINVDNSG